MTADLETRELLCELLRLFYDKDWVSGTGGGICARRDDGNLLIAPTGVHKERIAPEDFFVLDPADCRVVEPAANKSLKPSECSTIFSAIVRERVAGSVVHSHALSSVLAADLTKTDELVIEGLEMMKGIRSVANTDTHRVPVIANMPRESQLTSAVEAALKDPRFDKAGAILVRDHGAYIWGTDVWEAKRHTEVYHFVFEAIRARTA